MQRVDSRVGLSIESSSESCASDLSDSQASWDDELPTCEQPLNASSSGDYLSSSSWHTQMAGIDANNLPRTPSFRHRLPRRQRLLTENTWDDDFRISRHPRAPSLRFCLTICTLTLVLMSILSNSSSNSINLQHQQYNVRREEVITPPDHSPRSVAAPEGFTSLRNNYIRDEANGRSAAQLEGAPRNHGASKRRSHFAMARAAEQRPVFGAPVQSERFIVHEESIPSGSGESSSFENLTESPKWTSWLAAAALIGMLVETGYKEYRQCRLVQTDQRVH